VTKLDERPVRKDLTSRECSRLLCAVIAGAASAGVTPARLRGLFEILRVLAAPAPQSILDGPLDTELWRKTWDEAHLCEALRMQMTSALIGALAGALDEQAAPGALEDAVAWINENDDLWAALPTGPSEKSDL